MQRAGVTASAATPKGLRHGFGVAGVTNDVPLNMMQKWLGHTDIATRGLKPNGTKLYAKERGFYKTRNLITIYSSIIDISS